MASLSKSHDFIAVNTLGTDHGTGGAVILTGGAVDGGKSLGTWPGLGPTDLFEGRDLYPSNNVFDVFARILETHLNVPSSLINSSIFPRLVQEERHLLV